MYHDSFIRTIGALVGVAAVIALFAYTYSSMKQSDIYDMPMTINVVGEGKVAATPTIATFNFGVQAEAVTAKAAQDEATESSNAIIAFLKEQGVEDKDVQTSGYNVYPKYEYKYDTDARVCPEFQYCPPPSGRQVIVGYEVSQNVTVKIRKTDTIGTVLGGVGERGITNINGPTYSFEDDLALKDSARDLAIEDAKEKALKLADQLGVKIVRMTSYYENGDGGMPYYGMGMGGSEMMAYDTASVKAAPSVPVGESEITSQVNVTYEVE